MANTESSLLNRTAQAATFAFWEYFRPLVFVVRFLKRAPVPSATPEPAVPDRATLKSPSDPASKVGPR